MSEDVFDYKSFLTSLTQQPGVYRMINDRDEVIYVGKAKNLKKRVSSYFTKSDQSIKTRVMVAQIHRIEVTITHTENEALILESNLIKSLRPQYNVLYRDDKSYPYIYLSTEQDFPRLSYYRGARREKGRFFGPFPGAGAAKESLNLLQKLFAVRQCEDSFFRNRSRPCLQYQIKRCSAPCVNLVSKEDYAQQVRHTEMFLEGKNDDVINELVRAMENASQQLAFEKAAMLRDQIMALRKVQERQYITGEGQSDVDVIATMMDKGIACVTVFFIRGGNSLGSKSFFPVHSQHSNTAELLSAFIAQYYIGRQGGRYVPNEIICNEMPADRDWLEAVLSEQLGRKLRIRDKVRGERARWLKLAEINVQSSLQARLADKANMLQRFEQLQDSLSLDELPQRIECFDISHTMGEETVASCVVFDTNGPLKSDYRRFNITDITPGDDYAAMRQALSRRYKRVRESEGKLPDILLIDGAKGQLAQAEEVMEELGIDSVMMIGVAKGVERRPGLETLWLSGNPQPFILPGNSPALHLIQHVRDEAHRFAIQGHRARRAKKRQQSPLEEIPGLGPKRRQELLKQFGGLQGIARAGVEDLSLVKGVSKDLAQKIYDVFHSE
ncbi:MAG: excinuclease ABC subunit UvrC [Gammaproteobacteria bacterium]|nr:excinuclease ABC subunit UvrC [Gammaproteobacteria bacterium]